MSEKVTAILAAIEKELAPIIERAITEFETAKRDRSAFDKTVYTTKDIMARYGVKTAQAQKIIREAKYFCNGADGKLGRGRILWSELAEWEEVMRK